MAKEFQERKIQPYAPALIHCSTNQCFKPAILFNSHFFSTFINVNSLEECVYTKKHMESRAVILNIQHRSFSFFSRYKFIRLLTLFKQLLASIFLSLRQYKIYDIGWKTRVDRGQLSWNKTSPRLVEAAVNPGLPSTLPALSPKRAIYEVGGFDKNFKLSHFKEYHQESGKK